MRKQFVLICTMHDDIRQHAEDILKVEGLPRDVKKLAQKIVDLADQAKDRGQSMENRLREYCNGVESMGFKRVKSKK